MITYMPPPEPLQFELDLTYLSRDIDADSADAGKSRMGGEILVRIDPDGKILMILYIDVELGV